MKKSGHNSAHPRDVDGSVENKSSAQGGCNTKNSNHKNSSPDRPRDAEGRFTSKGNL